MQRYIIVRLIQAAVMLLFVSTLIYAILNAVPGGPFYYIRVENKKPPPESHFERLYSLLELDRPLFPGKYCPEVSGEQLPCRFDAGRYLRWLGRVLTGRFGESWKVYAGQTVLDVVLNRFLYTFLLMFTAQVMAILLAVPIGIYSAVNQYSTLDNYITLFGFMGQSMPTFWTGYILIGTLAMGLGWFPPAGVRSAWSPGDIIQAFIHLSSFGREYPQLAGKIGIIVLDGLQHMALPVAVLVFSSMAQWIRYVRTAMLDVIWQDYVRTARAKGLREQIVILKHAFRNALIPLVTLLTLEIPKLFGGAVIVEMVFNWPGMGRLFYDSLRSIDWPITQGILVITAVIIFFSNLLADLLYPLVDARIDLVSGDIHRL